MSMDIKIALEVIKHLNKEFNSHDFIFKLLELYPKVYGQYLLNHGYVNSADGEISSFLARHDSEHDNALKIKRTGDAPSENILRNITVCATWSK